MGSKEPSQGMSENRNNCAVRRQMYCLGSTACPLPLSQNPKACSLRIAVAPHVFLIFVTFDKPFVIKMAALLSTSMNDRSFAAMAASVVGSDALRSSRPVMVAVQKSPEGLSTARKELLLSSSSCRPAFHRLERQEAIPTYENHSHARRNTTTSLACRSSELRRNQTRILEACCSLGNSHTEGPTNKHMLTYLSTEYPS